MHVQKTFFTPTLTLKVRTPSCMRKPWHSVCSDCIQAASALALPNSHAYDNMRNSRSNPLGGVQGTYYVTCASPLTSGMSLKRAMTTENNSMKLIANISGRVTVRDRTPVASFMWKKKPSCTMMAQQSHDAAFPRCPMRLSSCA